MKEHPSNRAFLINLFGIEWVIKRDEEIKKLIPKIEQLKLF